MTTPPQSSAILARRMLMKAMNELPRVIVSQENVARFTQDAVYAIFCDFFGDLLENSPPRGPTKELAERIVTKMNPQMFVIALGFLASSTVFPVVKQAIPAVQARFNVIDYLMQELFTTTLYYSTVVTIESFIASQDRKEEFARKLLKIFGIGIEGETQAESTVIMENLDSVEMSKLSSELEVVIRKQIEDRLAAEEAAAKETRE
jgi:hypothetical protein